MKCSHCTREATQNLKLCQVCRESRADFKAAVRNGRIERGLCQTCGERPLGNGKECHECAYTSQQRVNTRARRLRIEALEAYGGAVCACCRCDLRSMLTIDHINGQGNADRKIHGSGTAFYSWLKKEEYPPGFQVLCASCNQSKFINGGICEHVSAN